MVMNHSDTESDMKVLLVNPPAIMGRDFIREGRCMQSSDSWATPWPPVTLAIMASLAEPYMEVHLLDFIIEKTDRKSARKMIAELEPDLLVINTGFPSIDGDMEFASDIKRTLPDCFILSFGVFFTLLKEEGLEYCSPVDAAIYGEPELSFEEFVREFSNTGEVPLTDGLLIRDGDRVVATPSRPLVQDLDKLPVPDRALLKNELYILPNNGKRFTLINSARGCPYQCIFCIAPIYYGKKVRRHSIEYILSEIKTCVNDYGIESFLFWEESFTSDKSYCIELCREITRTNLNIEWAATTRAASLDAEILSSMKMAGCMLLGLGIETGNQEILSKAGKSESIEDITRAVYLCRDAKIPTMGHFIFGLPGETPITAQQTIDYAMQLGLDYVQAYCAVPYPGTRLGELAQNKGWINTTEWSLYDFGGRSILSIDSIEPDEVNKARRKLLRSFYMRPLYILARIKEIRSLKRLLKISSFVKWIRGSGQ